MSHQGRIAFFLTVLSLSLAACSKQHEQQTVSIYQFTNTLHEPVTLDFYDNRDDYYYNGGILSSYQIEGGATASISLQALKTYWIDWYSKGYSFHNWGDSTSNGNAQGLPGPKMTIANENDHLFLQSFVKDTSRSVLLNGNGFSSTWKTTINTDPALNGSHIFIFKKDHSGIYTFTDAAGRSYTAPISYFIYNYQQGPFEASSFRTIVMNEQSAEFASLDFHADGGSSSFSRGRDSLMLTFRGFNDLYWAERQ